MHCFYALYLNRCIKVPLQASILPTIKAHILSELELALHSQYSLVLKYTIQFSFNNCVNTWIYWLVNIKFDYNAPLSFVKSIPYVPDIISAGFSIEELYKA